MVSIRSALQAVLTCAPRWLRWSFLAVALMVVAGGPVSAESDSETITWVLTDWPPLFILHDGRAPSDASQLGDGSADRVLREVIARLPNFRHRFVLLNTPRLWAGISSGQDLCYGAALRTPERLKLAYMTPYATLPPVAVIARHHRLVDFAHIDGSISIAQLMGEPELHGAIEPLRSYGAGLDSLIAGAPHPGLSVEGLERDGHALRLIEAGRLDYIVEYPFVVQYQIHHLDPQPVLDFYDIEELHEEPIGYFACTRDDWGRRVIAQIDQAIRSASTDPAIRTAFTQWMPPRIRAAEQLRADRYYDARVWRSLIE